MPARCVLLRVLASAALLAIPAQVHAQFFGQLIGQQYYWPGATLLNDYGTAVVGDAYEFSSAPYFLTNVSDLNVTFKYGYPAGWGYGAFNGVRLYDPNGLLSDIVSVTVNSATNMVGFDASRVSFDADNLWVDWNGLGFDESTIVSLDVNAVAVAPEPASLLLIATGLGAVGAVSRRRKGRSV